MIVKDQAIRDRIAGKKDPVDLNRPIFVKAGAGAGKTTCIKDRVLNLIKKGTDPARLVVITYTTKAANELINRIRDALEKESSAPDIEKALHRLSEAKISTVHSFCYDLLREYPMEFALDPEVELADEKSTALMLDHCFSRMIVNLSDGMVDSSEQALFRLFIDEQDYKTQSSLKETLLEIYRNRDLTPVDLDKTVLPERSHLETTREGALQEYYLCAKKLQKDIKEGCEDDKFNLFLSDSLGQVLDSIDLSDFPSYVLEGRTDLIKSYGNQTNYVHPENLKSLKDSAGAFKKSNNILMSLDKADHYLDTLAIYPLFEKTVEDYKQNYGFIDYFDCLFLVREGLKTHKTLRKLAEARFDSLIIDEFQDSDPMQADIAFLLAQDNPGKLFFVGDPKQSIYGFARADLETYGEAEENLSQKPEGEVLELVTNFRSAGGILTFVNTGFRSLLKNLSYVDMVPAPGHESIPSFTKKWVLDPHGEGEKLLANERRKIEATLTAKQLQKLMNERNLRSEDILILFRSSTAMKYYQHALEESGIPVINHSNREILKQRDMKELLNLLFLCAFPQDRFCRFAVDHSPLFNFPEEVLEEVLNRSCRFLTKFRELFDLSGLAALSWEEGREEYLFLKENLCVLAETEMNSNRHNLKKTMNDLKEKALNSGFQTRGNTRDETVYLQRRKENAVRLMTIHSSKGLESKVVILVGHEASSNRQKSQIVDRNRGGILVKSSFIDDKMAKALGQDDIIALYEKLKKEQEEEEKRLLYVAVTRAEEGFVLVTSKTSNKVNKTPFIDPLLNTQPSFDTNVLSDTGSRTSSPATSSRTEKGLHVPQDLGKILDSKNNVSRPVTELIAEPELFTGTEGRKHGIDFGTFVHRVMEVLCLMIHNKGRDLPTDDLVDKVTLEMGFKLPIEYIEEVKSMVLSFLKSKIAQRIEKAEKVEVEFPFYIKEKIHGRMDLILEEKEKLHIIDFKSDLLKVKRDEIKDHYTRQMALYISSVGEITGKSTTGECVYLFE